MVNSAKIMGRMVELRITQADLAVKLGITQPTVSQKINNIRPMDLDEAEKMAEILKIGMPDFASYFFST